MLCSVSWIVGLGTPQDTRERPAVMHTLPGNPLQVVRAAGIAGVWGSTEDDREEKPNKFKGQFRKRFLTDGWRKEASMLHIWLFTGMSLKMVGRRQESAYLLLSSA